MNRLDRYRPVLIPCNRVFYDGDFNCRGQFTYESVQQLAKNIAKRDLDIPVIVQPATDVVGGLADFDFRLVAGHRRFRAVTVHLKWTEIPAFVRSGMSDEEARLLNLTENLERKDLNPLEEALAIGRLFPSGASIRQIADKVDRDVGWVHKRIRLLRLPEAVQQMVAARRIRLVDLEIICRETAAEQQVVVAEKLAASKRGRGRKSVLSEETLKRKFRRKLNKAEMNGLIEVLFNSGIDDSLAARAITCCAGRISIEEFMEDVKQKLNH